MKRWSSGAAYDPYMGRWSQAVAPQFLTWLALPVRASWVDVGSGTGALIRALLQEHQPTSVLGIERSEEYLAFARQHITDPRVAWQHGDAEHLPLEDGSWDGVVSGLVLNFVPHPDQAVREWRRVVRPHGTVAAYVWDYVDGMPMMRLFWEAVTALHLDEQADNEHRQFDQWTPTYLSQLWQQAGLKDIQTTNIEIPMVFPDFDAYWTPFLGGQGPAPQYLMALPEASRMRLRDTLHASLPMRADGSLHLRARARAISGRVA